MGPLVSQMQPMLAPQQPVPAVTDPDWLYEIKFDGYRCLAGLDAGQVELRTRNGTNCTAWYPEVVQALAQIKRSHIIDGEASVLDLQGRSDCNVLHDRSKRRRWVPGTHVTLMAFDLLVHRGRDVRELPLFERKALLQRLLAKLPQKGVLYVQDLPADAKLFQEILLPLELEGFVAKCRDSTYQAGRRSTDWLKIKRKGAVPPERFKRV